MKKPTGLQGHRQSAIAGQAFRFAQAVQLHQMGRLDEAAAIYRVILLAVPRHADALRLLGTLRLQKGNAGEAVELLDSALRADPNQPDAYYNRGVALAQLNRLDEALKSYDRAVALRPDYSEAHNNRALMLHSLERFDESLKSCDRAIAVKPDNAVAHNNRGRALQSLKRWDDALHSYDRAIALDPRLADAHHNRGVVLQALDRKKPAIESFQQAVALNPGNAAARHLIAALSGADVTAAPADYVIRLFNEYAEKFDHHLQQELRYQTPTKMRRCFDLAFPHGKTVSLAVDLGCGTGLSGETFRDTARQLIGIDLSSGMLAQARRKKIYAQLIEGDLAPCLAAVTQPVDLVLAADVFVYVGDLTAVFAAVADKLTPGGVFCFSIEAAATGDYTLRDTGRFAHSTAYVERLVAASGLTPIAAEQTELRRDKDVPIMGWIYLLGKPKSAANG